jgi:putative endonuclease
MKWFVYVARCEDGMLYTGITKDLKRREIEHNTDDKKGAKSLRGKRPVKIVYFETYETQSEALKREFGIKNMSRAEKLELVKNI